MRVILSPALALTLLLATVACGDKASAGGDATTNPDAATQDGATPADATASDAQSDAAPSNDAVVPADAEAHPDAGTCPHPYTDLSLTLDSSGGFSGMGNKDYQLTGTSFTVTDPFAPTCTGTLTPAERDALLAAAELVQWTTLQPSYYPPANPSCCCGMFLYDLSLTLTQCPTGSLPAATAWCDQSLTDSLLPQALADFLALLDQYAAQIVAGC